MESGIYKIWFDGGIKCYIGSSVCAKRRLWVHKRNLKKNQHDNIHLQRAYNKRGEEKMKTLVVEYCEESLLLIREQHHIDSAPHLYNICRIAGNCRGIKHSNEVNKKKGTSRYGKDNPHYGKPAYNRKKVAQVDSFGNTLIIYSSVQETEKQTGVIRSHIRLACNGKCKTAGGLYFKYYIGDSPSTETANDNSPIATNKMVRGKDNLFSKKHNEDSKKRIKESLSEHYKNNESKNKGRISPMRKKVILITNNGEIIFNTLTDFAKHLNISIGWASMIINRKRESKINAHYAS